MQLTVFWVALVFLRTAEGQDIRVPEFKQKAIVEMCRSSWSNYQRETENLRIKSEKWVRSLSKDEIEKRLNNADPLINFIIYTWPSLLESQGVRWKIYAECAGRHSSLLRHGMSDPAADRAGLIEELRRCISVISSAGKKNLPDPFEKIMGCYKEQAILFKE